MDLAEAAPVSMIVVGVDTAAADSVETIRTAAVLPVAADTVTIEEAATVATTVATIAAIVRTVATTAATVARTVATSAATVVVMMDTRALIAMPGVAMTAPSAMPVVAAAAAAEVALTIAVALATTVVVVIAMSGPAATVMLALPVTRLLAEAMPTLARAPSPVSLMVNFTYTTCPPNRFWITDAPRFPLMRQSGGLILHRPHTRRSTHTNRSISFFFLFPCSLFFSGFAWCKKSTDILKCDGRSLRQILGG